MQELYIEYGPMVVVAVLGAFSWLYYKFLSDKIDSPRITQMVLSFGQELRAVIIEVNSTYVDALKDAGQDGEWTDEEKAIAKSRAIAKLKENWGMAGLQRLTKILGIGGSIDSWLGTQLEATLSDMKESSLPMATATLIADPKE